MKEIIKKYQTDKKYQNKINLLISTIFIIIITIYAASLSNNNLNVTNSITEETKSKKIIDIKDDFHYVAEIKIDDETYKYTFKKENNQINIIDISSNPIEYKYQNQEYYKLENEQYILTNKDNVFNKVNPNFIDIKMIEKYLQKAQKENNQYLVYLKDIILGEKSEEYFVISLSENKISIDYTPLIKKTNKKVNKYNVNIFIESGINIK